MSKYGDLIRAARRERGLTQKQLADSAGCSSVHICCIESGTRGPLSREATLTVSELLRIPYDTLMEASNEWYEKNPGRKPTP